MALKIAGETSIQFSDYVAVVARRKFVLVLASGGNVRTLTMKAFTEPEYRKLIATL